MPPPAHHVSTAAAILPAIGRFTVAACLVATLPAALPAADVSPQLMARFTKQVQPLILNKCSAGACHGGPTAHMPQFQRSDVSGRLDRSVTLKNIETLLRAAGKNVSATPFLTTITARHPASSTPTSLSMTPLTTVERATLEQWLSATAGQSESIAARPTATTKIVDTPVTPFQSTNRFRAMLDAAANPVQFPPPPEPQGIILGKDSE